jgi:hypothetical protein
MGVAITQRPIITINDSPVIKSRWVAAWNPIMYTFEFTSITANVAYLIVYIYEYGSNTLLGKSTYNPRGSNLRVDIAHEIRSYLYSKYDPDFDGELNCKDVGSTLKCYLKYQLVTIETGNILTPGSIISDESNHIYVTNSAKQIQEIYGQNMAEYVPYGVDGLIKAKFLSKFEEPVYFSGYQFAISFVYSELVIGHELKLLEDRMNINKSHLNYEETQLDTTQGFSINHLKIQDSYNSNVNFVDISISTGQPKEDLYVEAGYVEAGYTEAR